ncbi:TRI15 protein, partial [Probosciger aterrimus]|nr:TRI15 protein [Probosciger aterrimus]
LQEQEGVLLAQLDRVHEELNQERCRYISSISEREMVLDTLIAEIEKKCDQPMVEFLTVRLHYLPGRCDHPWCEAVKALIPVPVSPGLERTLKGLFKSSQMLTAVMAEFKVSLLSKIDRERVKVWLDPETASPYLNLSKDCKTVWLASGERELHDNPKRFTGSPSVLGSKG